MYTCIECGDSYYEVDMTATRLISPTATFGWVCNACADNYTLCAYSGHLSRTEDMVEVAGALWHTHYADRYAFRSAFSSEYFPLDRRITMGNGDYWASAEACAHGELSNTGQMWPRSEMITCADGRRRHPSEVGGLLTIMTATNEEGAQSNE
jgi:hypothetical protein